MRNFFCQNSSSNTTIWDTFSSRSQSPAIIAKHQKTKWENGTTRITKKAPCRVVIAVDALVEMTCTYRAYIWLAKWTHVYIILRDNKVVNCRKFLHGSRRDFYVITLLDQRATGVFFRFVKTVLAGDEYSDIQRINRWSRILTQPGRRRAFAFVRLLWWIKI
jgi:hypothetical protein